MTRLTTAEARKLLLYGQGLLCSPRRAATPELVRQIIQELGFVQLDSINVLERAHHLTLGTRLDGYRPSMLKKTVEDKRWLFEGWTHDASFVPMELQQHWTYRRRRFAQRMVKNQWWQDRLGSKPELFQAILERIQEEGELPTSAFREPRKQRGAWWAWTPTKAALEHLWRTGQLAISRRQHFQKFYDLPHRVIPPEHRDQRPDRAHTLEWSVRSALKRLGSATSTELAHFWAIFKSHEVHQWCQANLQESATLEGRQVWLRPDWREVLEQVPEAPHRLRLLCPFDPLIRDRKRAKRLFDFDYRFEAFVPAKKRVYGYYVLPLLLRESIVGRVDLKHDRDAESLLVKGLWWEAGQRPKRKLLETELKRLASRIGATQIDFVSP